MDVCDICFDPPQPLESFASGTVRLDTRDGQRRLLGEAVFRTPVRLHCVEVTVSRRLWTAEDWVLCAVTVYNRSSLPLRTVTVSSGASAFLGGSIRVNGVPAGPEGAVVTGLGPGCAAVVTWEVKGSNPENAPPPAVAEYEYRFGGQVMSGRAQST